MMLVVRMSLYLTVSLGLNDFIIALLSALETVLLTEVPLKSGSAAELV